MTYWPTPQDYNEAIQTPRACFVDNDLKGSIIEVNPMGLPRSASGNFASVYKAVCPGQSWADRRQGLLPVDDSQICRLT